MSASTITRSIWMLTGDFYPGIAGTERQVQEQSKALIARGCSVQVMTRRHGFDHLRGLPATDTVDGIPVHRLNSRGPGKVGSLLYVLNGMWHLLRHGRRGIYSAHETGAPAWLAVAARYLLGGRCTIKLRTGILGYERRLSTRIGRWRFLALLGLADRIVVVNREVEALLRSLGIPSNKIVMIPNAVDTSLFHPVSNQEKLIERKRLGLPTDQNIVLYVGRLEPVKGVDVLLHAWADLPASIRSGTTLIIVGDGSDRDHLLHMISSLEIQRSVFFVGEQRTVLNYYWAADVFVLPSRTEGLSNALIEAMACGLPVIASNVGGALDVVRDDWNGNIFESENSRELAQKLISMMEMHDKWKVLGEHARQDVEAYTDLNRGVDRLNTMYLELFPRN